MAETKFIKDPNFDIEALLKKNTEPTEEKEEKKETPLDMMTKSQNEKGMVVSNKDIAEGVDGPKRSHVDSDDRLEAYDKELEEYDNEIEKMKYLIQKKSVNSDIEHMEMIEELTSYTLKSLQKLQELHPEGAKLKGKYFDLSPDDAHKKEIAEKTEEEKDSENEAPKEDEFIPVSELKEETDEDTKRKKIVKVLIDKTNLGVPPEFDEIEKDNIFNADQVDLVEVETVDLESVIMDKPDKSFMESVQQYEMMGSQVPMIFPCSRFRATVNGLSNGEMGDIALTVNNTDYDSENKKFSIIYNKIKNCSFGRFDNYEDFLDNFAYNDIPMAIYAMYIATQPEEDHITLRCGIEECGKSFNTAFRSRSLLRLDRCTDTFLEIMDKVTDANIEEAQELFKNAPHRKQKRIKLPNSGWIVSLAHITCKEYLDIFAKNDSLEEFLKTHPDDKNGVRFLGMQFIRMVRSIAVPKANGRYTEYTDTEDIINAMYYMNSDDFQILNTILDKYINDYTPVFGIENVVCPHCGAKSDFVSVEINDLVFRAYRRKLSTTVNLKRLEDL